jgi:hypothetical protein
VAQTEYRGTDPRGAQNRPSAMLDSWERILLVFEQQRERIRKGLKDAGFGRVVITATIAASQTGMSPLANPRWLRSRRAGGNAGTATAIRPSAQRPRIAD